MIEHHMQMLLRPYAANLESDNSKTSVGLLAQLLRFDTHSIPRRRSVLDL